MAETQITVRARLLGWPQLHILEGETERPLSLPGNKPQALLYYLLWVRRPVSRDLLMALLWPESDTARARMSLRNALYQLQKALPPGALEVDRHAVALSSRYRWDVDVHHLTALLEGEVGLDEVQQAVRMYRGDFLEGFHVPDAPEFAHWLTSVSQRLRTRLLDALDQGIRQALLYGRWETATFLLSFAVAVEPWREDFHYALIQVLMWQGKHTAALKQYQRCCRALESELGAEPSTELQQLMQEVLSRHQQPPPFHVPDLPLPLVGRDADLDALCALLQEHRLVTLVGPNGVGKTMLALAFAHRHRYRFARGIYFISLEELEEPAFVAHQVALRLGLTPDPNRPINHQIVECLREQEILLILDNMEHLVQAASDVAYWLRFAPKLRVLVTAQEPLGLRHEGVYTVRPLAYPSEDDLLVSPEDYPAGQLFLTLWKRFVPSPSPAEADAESIARLCRLLEGLPLALELAAMQLRQQPLVLLIQALEKDLDVLQAQWPESPSRHRSLRALFEHLWAALSPEERTRLMALSVFPGPFTREAASAIANLSSLDLQRLLTRGLVQPLLDWPQGLVVHRVIRMYLREKMGPGEHPRAPQHAQYFLRWMAHLPISTPWPAEIRQQVQRILPNLIAAWFWAVRHRRWALLQDALAPLHAFYEVQGLYSQGVRVFQETIAELEGVDHTLVGQLYARAAALAFRHGLLGEARSLAERALMHISPNEEAHLFARNVLGVVYMHLGDFERSMTVLEGVVREAQARGLHHEHIKGLVNLSSLYVRTGRYEQARAFSEEGLRLCQKVDDPEGVGFFRLHLGTLALLAQRWDEVETHFQEALRVAQETGMRHFELHALLGLAAARALRDDAPEDIAEVAEKAVRLARKMGDGVAEARGQGWVAWARHRQGRYEEAWQTLMEALAHVEQDAEPTRLHLLAIAAYMWALQGGLDRAADLAAYVAAHPATEAATRERAEMLLAMLQRPVPDRLPEAPPVWP